ncbi:hypothetical protein [Rhodobaculum claviforme]|uniref:Lipoprotein n=1 Tax=Rhodobaculum claviforme TaxID=1549854 RepID=A0A934TL87_9RHOB|nr:hypothetical protein [Rhodobaculum claviforme]MBK5928205.1 hypothetical protein [Rhodobaculum claviforme]
MRILSLAGVAAAALLLAGCGDNIGEQALFGGAAGVGVAAVAGGDPVAGGLVGAGGNVAFCQLNPGACRR